MSTVDAIASSYKNFNISPTTSANLTESIQKPLNNSSSSNASAATKMAELSSTGDQVKLSNEVQRANGLEASQSVGATSELEASEQNRNMADLDAEVENLNQRLQKLEADKNKQSAKKAETQAAQSPEEKEKDWNAILMQDVVAVQLEQSDSTAQTISEPSALAPQRGIQDNNQGESSVSEPGPASGAKGNKLQQRGAIAHLQTDYLSAKTSQADLSFEVEQMVQATLQGEEVKVALQTPSNSSLSSF